jgi:hypothetical protein
VAGVKKDSSHELGDVREIVSVRLPMKNTSWRRALDYRTPKVLLGHFLIGPVSQDLFSLVCENDVG